MLVIARASGLSYSRYADDMSFGGDERFDVTGDVTQVVEQCGFNLNSSKTRLAGPGQPRFVTGLFVDEEQVRLRKNFKRKLIQALHYVEKFGIDDHSDHLGKSPVTVLEQLRGRLHYAKQVEPEWFARQRQSYPRTVNALLPVDYEDARVGYLVARRRTFLAEMSSRGRTSPGRYIPASSYSG